MMKCSQTKVNQQRRREQDIKQGRDEERKGDKNKEQINCQVKERGKETKEERQKIRINAFCGGHLPFFHFFFFLQTNVLYS